MLFYKKYKNNNQHSSGFGKYYARVVTTDSVTIDDIADRMQASCTVKRADVLAVLSELGPTMKDLLQESRRVVLPYLGAFKLGIKTKGESDPDKFSVIGNIKNAHVIFQPEFETEIVGGSRRRVYAMTAGANFKDIEFKNKPAEEPEEEGEGD
ncbi:MAG: DNA-binding protein [Prevotella sp.]|nr:DNA-binding protein [Prevotella sp.]